MRIIIEKIIQKTVENLTLNFLYGKIKMWKVNKYKHFFTQ